MAKFRFTAFRKSQLKRPAVCLGGVFALLIGVGVGMAMPAKALTVTTTDLEHVCKQIGTADTYGNEAFICTDLQQQAYYNSSNQFIGYDVVPRTEAFCENSAHTVVQCSNITVANEAAGALGGTYTGPVYSQACGHSNGNCPAGRYFVVGYTLNGQPFDCVGEVWGVTLAAGTSIQLPSSDKIIDLSANYGTPHTSVGSC